MAEWTTSKRIVIWYDGEIAMDASRVVVVRVDEKDKCVVHHHFDDFVHTMTFKTKEIAASHFTAVRKAMCGDTERAP